MKNSLTETGFPTLDLDDFGRINFNGIMAIRLMTLVSLVLSCTSFADENLIPKGLIRLGSGAYFSPYALVVDKKARMLTLWKQEANKLLKVKEFPSDMGKEGGDKTSEGDHKTPEGIYFLQKLMEGPGLTYDLYGVRAYTMDYPNVFDRRLGKSGSGIWLHAIPEKLTLERGSRGCVVVRNEAITELGKYITLEKTPILIYESVAYTPAVEHEKTLNETEAWLGRWLQAWKSKNIDDYMKFYSEKFTGNGMNWTQWKKHKTGLAQMYNEIDVHLFAPVIFQHEKGWVVRTLQAYKSDKHEDFGEKTLYLQYENDQLKIIEENWGPVERNDAIQNLAQCCSTVPAAGSSN
jgi:murein L,D-transpeptidase YafK